MKRNVVLVTIDSLRADHCGYMGYHRDTTPTLDSMARDGLSFETAVAPGPRTFESMPVIFTGDPITDRDGNGEDVSQRRRTNVYRHMRIRDTLPQQFARDGYSTAAFTPNPYTSRLFGFDAGFDYFEDFLTENSPVRRIRPNVGDSFMIRVLWNYFAREEMFKPWESIYDQMVDWATSAQSPYFLWVILMDVHTPFFVSRRYRSDNSWLDMVRANWRFWSASAQAATGNVADVKASMSGRDHERIVNAYDDTVSYVDECLAKLRNDLSQTDPTIVVHADHGEALGEHGTYGHHATLYEENLHVPFVVWNAGSDETVTTPTSLKRVPEILAIVRQNSMELSAEYFESISEFVVAESKQGGQITARWGDWKLMKGPEGESLYRLDESPDEKTDVLETYPDVADVLRHGINRRETQNSETQTVIKGAEKIGLEQS